MTAAPLLLTTHDDPRGGIYWRSHCADCTWTSRDLPFPTPDQALHALSMHGVLCPGRKR